MLFSLKFKNENMISTTIVVKKDCNPHLCGCIKLDCGEFFGSINLLNQGFVIFNA